MRFMKAWVIISVLLISVKAVYSQEDKIPGVITQIAEELSEYDTDADAAGEYALRLYDLSEKPVRINTADEQELSRLFFLTDFQVKALADYVRKTGTVYTVYEIAAVPGFSASLARMVAPFVSLTDEKQETGKAFRLRNNILSNFTVRHPAADTSAPG